MLVVEGFKTADGVATIQFEGNAPFTVNGVFLYRPDKDLWYVAPCMAYPWGGTFTRDELLKIEEGGTVTYDRGTTV